MTNLQNALNLLFVAHSALSSLESLECPDEIFVKDVKYAQETICDAWHRLSEMVPYSEFNSLINP